MIAENLAAGKVLMFMARLSVFEWIPIRCRAKRDAKIQDIWQDIDIYNAYADEELAAFKATRSSLFSKELHQVTLKSCSCGNGRINYRETSRREKLSKCLALIDREVHGLETSAKSFASERDLKIIGMVTEFASIKGNHVDSKQTAYVYNFKMGETTEEYNSYIRAIYDTIEALLSERKRIVWQFGKKLEMMLSKNILRSTYYYNFMLKSKPKESDDVKINTTISLVMKKFEAVLKDVLEIYSEDLKLVDQKLSNIVSDAKKIIKSYLILMNSSNDYKLIEINADDIDSKKRSIGCVEGSAKGIPESDAGDQASDAGDTTETMTDSSGVGGEGSGEDDSLDSVDSDEDDSIDNADGSEDTL
ncbi:MAG: hypothetical protein LBT59_14755 [Clostridiales bacterium]|jgi:hypothetical protein|nr:hypothetical protein [Clostridiales bacterium]